MIKTTLIFEETELDFLNYSDSIEINLDYDLKLKKGDRVGLSNYVRGIPLNEFREIQDNTEISDDNLANLREKILENTNGEHYKVKIIRYEFNSDKSVTKEIFLYLK